jgi:hypothetical protein
MTIPQPDAPLPRVFNPNLTEDEVRLVALLVDSHYLKCTGTLGIMDIFVMTQQIALTQDRGGGMSLAEGLKEKFDRLYEIVGCNCGDPSCSQAKHR